MKVFIPTWITDHGKDKVSLMEYDNPQRVIEYIETTLHRGGLEEPGLIFNLLYQGTIEAGYHHQDEALVLRYRDACKQYKVIMANEQPQYWLPERRFSFTHFAYVPTVNEGG